MKNYLIPFLIVAIIGGVYFAGFQHGKSKTQVKYLEKEKLVKDSTYAEFIRTTLSARLDSLRAVNRYYRYLNLQGKIDSFYIHDTTYLSKPLKIVSSDTLVTNDTTLTLKIKYLFPPVDKFDIWANVKHKIINRTEIKEVERPETFWDRFGSSIQIGIGYGWLKKNVDIYSGIGFHFKIN